MSENSITQKLSTEGADMLTLAGVNDGNLVELSRLGGVKVAEQKPEPEPWVAPQPVPDKVAEPPGTPPVAVAPTFRAIGQQRR